MSTVPIVVVSETGVVAVSVVVAAAVAAAVAEVARVEVAVASVGFQMMVLAHLGNTAA